MQRRRGGCVLAVLRPDTRRPRHFLQQTGSRSPLGAGGCMREGESVRLATPRPRVDEIPVPPWAQRYSGAMNRRAVVAVVALVIAALLVLAWTMRHGEPQSLAVGPAGAQSQDAVDRLAGDAS